ncbi:MAG: glycine--tRNA ligase subunit beta [Spirochaetota bacterium]
MKDLIIEILTEEIPHTFIPNAEKSLAEAAKGIFSEEKLSYQRLTSFSTPRRLALLVEGLIEKQDDISQEQKGPLVDIAFKDGTLTKAGEGFFRANGITALAREKIGTTASAGAPFIKDISGKQYLMVRREKKGLPTTDVIAANFLPLLAKIHFPKRMRWGNGDFSFVRPIRGILCMFGKDVIPVSAGGISSSNNVTGHRLLSPAKEALGAPLEYEPLLKKKNVIVRASSRRSAILEALAAIESKHGLAAVEKERVADMTVNLVEWPVLIAAEFDASFLAVPEEVLISEMIEHQMYFPMRDKSGKLTTTFVITANQPETKHIAGGNIRVITARLTDGAFLYREDVKRGLAAMREGLSTLLFRKELGSVAVKVARMLAHADAVVPMLSLEKEKDIIRETVSFMKADLVSSMVYEFPHLQGIMGGYFARAGKFPNAVTDAITEHYRPLGSGDSLPATTAGRIASLVDKMDNIISGFWVGDIPTGSQDPNALRRQALGVLRIVLEAKWRFDLPALVRACTANFDASARKGTVDEIVSAVADFIRTRFEVYLGESCSYDAVRGVLSLGLTDIFDSASTVAAIDEFRKSNESSFNDLLTVFKRVSKIIGTSIDVVVDEKLLSHESEHALYRGYTEKRSALLPLLAAHDHTKAFALLAALAPALDRFFTDVLVMDKDEAVKKNRIALLAAIDALFRTMLDFRVIVAKK